MTELATYIANFKRQHPTYQDQDIAAYAFGGGEEMADELAALVVAGHKQGTTSLYQAYEVENEPLPKVGDVCVILDGKGRPTSVVINTAIEVLPFNDVTAHHALLESEGDRTLAYWRRVHIDFFTHAYTPESGIKFTPASLVVFEKFQLLYK